MKHLLTIGLILGAAISCSKKADTTKTDLKLLTQKGVRLWPKGIVPYKISGAMPANRVQRIQAAVEKVTQQTVVKLIPLREAESYGLNPHKFIKFVPDQKHCSSPVGQSNWGYNRIKVANWCKTGSIMHEIFHSLGIKHEQLHPESGLQIKQGHIVTGMEHNFTIRNGVPLTAYDKDSIMHYHSFGFSICNNLDDPKWDSLSPDELPDASCKDKDWRHMYPIYPGFNGGIDCRVECATILDPNGKTFSSNRDHLTEMDIRGIANLYRDIVAKPEPIIPTSAVSLVSQFNNGVVHASGYTRVGSGYEIYQMATASSFADFYYIVKSTTRPDAYRIVSTKYNTCLVGGRKHYATFDKFNVYHKKCDGGIDSYWNITPAGDGYFEFRNLDTDLCMHHSNGSVLTGSHRKWQIYQSDCDGSRQNLMRFVN